MYAVPRDASEVQGAGEEPLQDLWSTAGIHATFWIVPDLLPGTGFAGTDPGRGQGELVSNRASRPARCCEPAFKTLGKGFEIMMTDPIADMLTRIRNAIIANHTSVVFPSSKLKLAIVRILKDEGFIQNYDVIPDRPQPKVRIWLKYVGERRDRASAITGLKRVSSPGCRVYAGKGEIPWVLSGVGIAIVSTSRGILTDRQARQTGVGGEVMCHVW